MGEHLALDEIRTLMRSAAEHGELASRGFVADLVAVLARQGAFDAAGLLLAEPGGGLRAMLLARDGSGTEPLGWGAALAQPQPCRTAVAIDSTAEEAGLGAALADAGLQAAAWAPIGPPDHVTGWVCAAAQAKQGLRVPLWCLNEAAQTLSLLESLLSPESGPRELAAVEQLDYLAAIGRLAGGLVHEVNNPATFIALAAGQIEKSLARSEHAAAMEAPISLAREINESIGQMRAVVSDFHVVSTVARHAVSGSLDLQRMLRASATLTAISYRTHARLELDIGELPSCPASFMSLVPVVVHLLINSIQAIPAGAEGALIELRASADDRSLTLLVRDNGRGMDEATRMRAVEPFFSTRVQGQGAGLGLTLARDAARRLGGRLLLESEPGKGTTVRVEVPVPGALS
jgi:signal transduction histidine kinase